MKFSLLTTAFFLACSITIHSQVLYGTTHNGGNEGAGTINKFTPATNELEVLKSFKSYGTSPVYTKPVQAGNGKLYAMTSMGGKFNFGTIFSYDPTTAAYIKIRDFDTANGAKPFGSLVKASNGKLYGMTFAGGSSGYGVIFSFDPATGVYRKLVDLSSANGSNPRGSLFQASDGKLYGMTFNGGSMNLGVIFSFDILSSTYTKLFDFNSINGEHPNGDLMQASNGKFYGMTNSGGGGANEGVIFSFDPIGSVYKKIMNFTNHTVGLSGGGFIQASNGKLYSTSSPGGDGGSVPGFIFSIDPATDAYKFIIPIPVSSGNIFQATDGRLYGVSIGEGAYNMGTIFSYDLTTSTYSTVHDFDETNGSSPYGTLMQANDGKIYGLTYKGGGGGGTNGGVLFSLDPLTSAFTNLSNTAKSTTGSDVSAALTRARDGKMYGMTYAGGRYGYGAIFTFDPVTSEFKKIVDFTKTNGSYPYGSLTQATDGKLYGLASSGGSAGFGVLFSYDPITSHFTKLKEFDQINGSVPLASLVQASNGKLYGVLSRGGSLGYGAIFSFDPSSLIVKNLYNFDRTNGSNPNCSLVEASDGKLYGTTTTGGSIGTNGGVIFSFDPSNATFTKLYDFPVFNGKSPTGQLIQATDGRFYGMATLGGKTGNGTLYCYIPISNTLINLKDFDGINGSTPYGSLLQASDGKLYGSTYKGGTHNKGVIFSYDLLTGKFTKLKDFTNDNGAQPFMNAAFIELNDTPVVNVVNNCGNSVLSVPPGGEILWSTGATTPSITVTKGGTYAVKRTIKGISTTISGAAAPKQIPAGPVVTVQDKCGSTVLSIPAGGSVLWGMGADTPSITVTKGGTYAVKRTINGCTSAQGSGIAAPKPLPDAPTVTIVNDCGMSTLTASGMGTVLWGMGATTPSITVTKGGTYIVKRTLNGCASLPGSGIAAPKVVPAAPTVNVINNCGTSVLSIPAGGTVLWGNGATNTSITVTKGGTYAVKRTLNGCTSSQGTGIASPSVDKTPPSVTCVPAQAITAPSGYLVPGTAFNASATDNCGIYSLLFSLEGSTVLQYDAGNISLAGKILNPGVTTIKWKAIDVNGNSTTCSTTVTVSNSNPRLGKFPGTTLPGNPAGDDLEVRVLPNPASTHFNIEIGSNSKALININIFDITGRLLEQKTGIVPNTTLQLGYQYRSGFYFAEVIQGKRKLTVQMIKIK